MTKQQLIAALEAGIEDLKNSHDLDAPAGFVDPFFLPHGVSVVAPDPEGGQYKVVVEMVGDGDTPLKAGIDAWESTSGVEVPYATVLPPGGGPAANWDLGEEGVDEEDNDDEEE